MPAIPPPPPSPSLVFAVPSVYTNFVSFTYINGVFRVTFFEQHIEAKPGAPQGEMSEVLAPRASVTMVPAVAADFIAAFKGLYDQVAKSVVAAASQVMPQDESGRMQ